MFQSNKSFSSDDFYVNESITNDDLYAYQGNMFPDLEVEDDLITMNNENLTILQNVLPA